MDTGGFFVALLKKVKPLSKDATERMAALARESRGGVEVDAHVSKCGDGDAEKKSSDDKETGDATMTESSAAEDKKGTEPADESKLTYDKLKEEEKAKEEKMKSAQKAPTGKVGQCHKRLTKKDLSKEDFIPTDPSIWAPIVQEYGLADTFPKEQFFCRASGEAKILYFISKSIKEDLIDHGAQERVTVINSGLKGFERCSLNEKTISYRLAQEGVQYVVPHMTKRIINANMEDFYACIKEGFLPFDGFSESFHKQLDELSPGAFVVALEGYEKDISKKMFLVMWRRTNKMINCFVAKVEMEAIVSKMRALGYVAKEEKKEVVEKPAEKQPEGKFEEEPAEAVEDKMEIVS